MLIFSRLPFELRRQHIVMPWPEGTITRPCLLEITGVPFMDEISLVGLLGLSKRFADGFRLFARSPFPDYFKIFYQGCDKAH